MLNKEDILALAWEHSEGSGKRYTFTEESLLEMVRVALSRQNSNEVASPAQDDREAFEEPIIVAYGDPKAFKNLRIDGHKGAPYNHEWMWASAAPGLVPMIELDQHERIVAALTRPAQTAPHDAPYAPGIAEQLERTDWTPEEALRWYAEGKHFDTVNGRTRIIDSGAIASNALKHLSLPYLEMKGDAELSELRTRRPPKK